MAKNNLPQDIPYTSLNDTRKELNSEINSKLPIWVFSLFMVLLVPICSGIMVCLYNEINDIKDNKLQEMQKRITAAETKIEGHTSSSQKFQEDLQRQLTVIEKKFDSRQEAQPKLP